MRQGCQQYNWHLQCLTFGRSEEWCSKNTIFLSQKYRECWKCLWLCVFIIVHPISRFIPARRPPSMWRLTLYYFFFQFNCFLPGGYGRETLSLDFFFFLINWGAVLVNPACFSVFVLCVFRWYILHVKQKTADWSTIDAWSAESITHGVRHFWQMFRHYQTFYQFKSNLVTVICQTVHITKRKQVIIGCTVTE